MKKVPHLKVDEVETMTCPITEEVVNGNILRLKNNKSPGVDGLPGENYKTLVNECRMNVDEVSFIKTIKDLTLHTSCFSINRLCVDL